MSTPSATESTSSVRSGSRLANGSSLKNWALTNAGWNFSASQNAWRPRHTVYGPSSRSSYTQSSVRYDAAASASRELNAR